MLDGGWLPFLLTHGRTSSRKGKRRALRATNKPPPGSLFVIPLPLGGEVAPQARVRGVVGRRRDSLLRAILDQRERNARMRDTLRCGRAVAERSRRDGGFDVSLVAFRENEDKEWDVREIVQRMACFLRDRWRTVQPTQMYRSKGKALDLFTSEEFREEFRKLHSVAVDVITLPEFIQAEFSRGDTVKGKRFGGLRAVKSLRGPYVRPGTTYETVHQMDLAASLPLAAAFRELLELRGDCYRWKLDPKEVFRRCAEDLYKTLAAKSRVARGVNELGHDTEYWTQAANIVLRAKDELLAERLQRQA